MTRTRPGSIIRECMDGDLTSPIFSMTTGYTRAALAIVKRVTRHCATTTHGYKIRSWIVVKE
jgi:hypothetical protein